jgi:hypothetical protein
MTLTRELEELDPTITMSEIKIRQQLPVFREAGLLLHIGSGSPRTGLIVIGWEENRS